MAEIPRFLAYGKNKLYLVDPDSLGKYLGIEFVDDETTLDPPSKFGHLYFYFTDGAVFSGEAYKRSIAYKKKLVTIIIKSSSAFSPPLDQTTVIIVPYGDSTKFDELENEASVDKLKGLLHDKLINVFNFSKSSPTKEIIVFTENNRAGNGISKIADYLGIKFVDPQSPEAVRSSSTMVYACMASPKFFMDTFIKARQLASRSGRNLVVVVFVQEGTSTWLPEYQLTQNAFWGPIIPMYYNLQVENISYENNVRGFNDLQLLFGLYTISK